MTHKTITITHTIASPSARVFQAWIDPKDLVHWCHASEGWTTPYAKTEPHTGGKFDIGFQSPDRKHDFAFEGIYELVDAPKHLVMKIADGRPVDITFAEHHGKTTLTLILTLEHEHSAEQQREGWTAMIVNLAHYLETTKHMK